MMGLWIGSSLGGCKMLVLAGVGDATSVKDVQCCSGSARNGSCALWRIDDDVGLVVGSVVFKVKPLGKL